MHNIRVYRPPLSLSAPNPHNGQTHSNKSSATANELFECVWPVFGVGAQRVKIEKHIKLYVCILTRLGFFNNSVFNDIGFFYEINMGQNKFNLNLGQYKTTES